MSIHVIMINYIKLIKNKAELQFGQGICNSLKFYKSYNTLG